MRILILFVLFSVTARGFAQNIVVDRSKTRQTIIGLGVNANPQSWSINPDSVRKVVDLLIDSLGCTSFRLMFDDCDWEGVNDNDDPNSYNWKFFDSIYSQPRFTGIWDMIRYLNQKGITDITLSPDGAAPKWMGGTKLSEGMEAEYAETISSLLVYARQRLSPAVQFNEISPINESSCDGNEGVLTTKAQFRKIYQGVAENLDKARLDNLYITGPDDCGRWLENFQAMTASPATMKRLKYFGQHDYGDESAKAREIVALAKKVNRPAIMTEVNAVCVNCDGGVYNKDYGYLAYARPAYKDILQDLNEGVAGIQVWEAYDSRYHHPNRTLTWSMWGIFAVNDTNRPDVYTMRPHFDVLKHLYRFVKPGDRRVAIAGSAANAIITAFTDPAGKKVLVTGVNDSAKATTFRIQIVNPGTRSGLSLYLSDADVSFRSAGLITPQNGVYTFEVPANGIFTLAGK